MLLGIKQRAEDLARGTEGKGVMMTHVVHDSSTDHGPEGPADSDQLARLQAIGQIEREADSRK